MKKAVLIMILSGFVTGLLFAQLQTGQVDPRKVQVPDWHYQPEFTFDTPSDPASWQKQPRGLNVAFGTTDELRLPLERTGWPGSGHTGNMNRKEVLQ